MTDVSAIACSRMYNVSAAVRQCWDDLFVWLSDTSGIGLEIIAHAPPAPLSELWARSDLGAVVMCGYPLSRLGAGERPVPLAVPVSTEAWASGEGLYASHIVAIANGAVKSADDLAKAKWGWTVRDSQSGYHAPRSYLAELPGGYQNAIETAGPLLNPNGIIAALKERRIEVGAIDAYAFQLMSLHEPQMIEGLQIVATTRSMAAPMLIASTDLPSRIIERLRETLISAHSDSTGRALLGKLGLQRFADVDIAAYAQLPISADSADEKLGSTW